MNSSNSDQNNLSLDACIFLLSTKQKDDTCPYVVLTKEQISCIKAYLLDLKLKQYQEESVQEPISLNKRRSRVIPSKIVSNQKPSTDLEKIWFLINNLDIGEEL